KIDSEIEAVVGGEQQGRTDGDPALGGLFAVDLQDDVERTRGSDHCVSRLHLNDDFAGGEPLLRLDLRALNLEEIVFVAEYAVLDIATETSGERAEGI